MAGTTLVMDVGTAHAIFAQSVRPESLAPGLPITLPRSPLIPFGSELCRLSREADDEVSRAQWLLVLSRYFMALNRFRTNLLAVLELVRTQEGRLVGTEQVRRDVLRLDRERHSRREFLLDAIA